MNVYSFLPEISIYLLYLMVAKVALLLVLSLAHYINSKKRTFAKMLNTPLVSVIVPCCNEEPVLRNCIKGLIKQDYENMEIVVVDDGSKDKTKCIGEQLEKEYPKKIKFYAKPNSGKASALNHGILRAKGEIVICIDADSIFLPNTVRNLVKPFSKKGVVAVAGNVKVANRNKILNKQQALEYISGLNLQRRSFAILGCPQVISGAIGAFRKDKLIEIGGYSTDTIVEDMDVTISLLEKGGKIEYNGDAIAYTETPETLRDFIKQRHRWVFGGFQVLKKHKNLIFNPKYKTLGIIGIPYFLIFTWIDVFISLLFFISVYSSLINSTLFEILLYYLVFCIFQLFLFLYSITIDKEDKKLTLMGLFEGFWYNHLISIITVKAGIDFIKGERVLFNNSNSSRAIRLGKNLIPSN